MIGPIDLAERGRVPDLVLRAAVRARIHARLRRLRSGTVQARSERFRALLAARAAGPITADANDANRQHYEVPTELFQLMLGPQLKYSSGYWPPGTADLRAAEDAMLALTAERAQLADGQRVLDLGCGWGALTLWLAERYPRSRVTAVSASKTQRRYIEERCADRRLGNVEAITADVAELDFADRFDRIVSVEMLEHVANHRALLGRIRRWLLPDGRLFVHVFSHADTAWEFDHEDASDWIGRYFFSGGVMPSDDLLLHEQRDMVVVDHWRLDGTHYQRTLEAWLRRLDASRDQALEICARAYGPDEAVRWLGRWRLFLITSAELWGYRDGAEFGLSHYLMAPRATSQAGT